METELTSQNGWNGYPNGYNTQGYGYGNDVGDGYGNNDGYNDGTYDNNDTYNNNDAYDNNVLIIPTNESNKDSSGGW